MWLYRPIGFVINLNLIVYLKTFKGCQMLKDLLNIGFGSALLVKEIVEEELEKIIKENL